MNTLKKTLFLTNKNDNHNKSLSTLILEKKNSTIFCTMKCYYDIPNGDLILGIQCKDKIIKQNISFENNPYNFILSQNIDLDEKISCVLISNYKNEFTPIIWGSEKKDNYKSQILSSLRENISKLSQNKNEINVINSKKDKTTYSADLDPSRNQSPHSIEIINDSPSFNLMPKTQTPHEMNFNNIQEVSSQNIQQLEVTNEVAMAQASLFEYTDDEVEKIIDNNIIESNITSHNFYNMIAEQLQELFDKYPREYNLEKLIENSKWAKITYDNENKPYVVGIIYENDDIKYICYGVPGSYDTPQPNELIGYSQWLPTDIADPYNNGYWVMYQDADTGENILVE